MMRQEIGFLLMNLVLQQQFTVPTHKSSRILNQNITSEEVEVSEPLVSFVTSSDHGDVHFDLLEKHGNLAVKKASSRSGEILTW